VTFLLIFLTAASQLRIAAPSYEDVRAFTHKLVRRRQTDATIATSNERDFSIKLGHVFLLRLTE